jgi:5'(3')-deoxyribonucleotidase
MNDPKDDSVALIDLDGTVADYDKALKAAMLTLQSPGEQPYGDRYTGGTEPPYVEARRKMIQRQPGFWANLDRLPLGFEVVDELRQLGFGLHVLTKGPQSNSGAWAEKLDWSRKHLPDATVTVTGDKSLVYGRVLFDDFPPYFTKWLAVRPRGLVICLAHPWNEGFAKGGPQAHPNVIRYDGTDGIELREALRRAYERAPRVSMAGDT